MRLLEAAIDAKSVFSAVEAKETKVPAGCSLLSPIQCVRELIDEQRLSKLYWIGTRDMLPDGLTKGPMFMLLSLICVPNVCGTNPARSPE